MTRFASTEHYQLGPRVLSLAVRMLSARPVRDVAARYLRRLSIEVDETVASGGMLLADQDDAEVERVLASGLSDLQP